MKLQKHIVIVDDEQDILELIRFNIEKNGHRTTCIDNGEFAVKKIRDIIPDLIVLDLMLPGIDGLDVCRILKSNEDTNEIPVLMLTAKGEESDIIKGLEIGADDYVLKPFSVKVLMARIKALLRRKSNELVDEKDYLEFEEMRVHAGKREVVIANKTIELTFTEFQILFLLASHPNWVYTRSQIIDEVRGDDYPVTDRSVDFQIVGLRKKLLGAARFIKTVRGVGYRFSYDQKNI